MSETRDPAPAGDPLDAAAPPWIMGAPVQAAPAPGWRLPAEMEPSWTSRPWPRRHWRPLLALSIVAILVAAVVVVAGSFVRVSADLLTASDGQITGVYLDTFNGATTINIYAAPGLAGQQVVDLTCNVIKPILSRDGEGNVHFFLFDRAGDVLATEQSRCDLAPPTPTSTTNPAA